MTRVLVMCLVAVITVGCKSREEPVRGAHRDPIVPVTKTPPRAREAPTRFPRPEIDEPEVVEEAEEAPKRDLARELQVAVGSPTNCLADYQASDAQKVRINIRGTVRPSGMIIQPSASAMGMSRQARECVERRVGAVVLRPLEDGISQSVSTYVEVNYEPAKVVRQEAPPDPSQNLPGVRPSMPKLPEIPPSGRPIDNPPSVPSLPKQPEIPRSGVPVRGPKPIAIDGYEVDESAQEWTK